ncbi:MAG: methionine--tRNA ligase [Opitutales bacterium]|nr:methionine--tRNA ligase [Opitutales bacterium]
MKSFYITTAIDYANGAPHLGHAYEKVLTDVIARFRRMMGDDVYFLTGLDEHGQKVQQAAQKRGVDPIVICDEIAESFQQLCRDLHISNDDYIRTTQSRHKSVVQSILQKLYDDGEIYRAEYTGFYSVKEERFLQEKDKVDGEWSADFGEVTELTETNYFFKLSKYQDWLIDYIKSNTDFIFPRFRAKQVLEFLKEPINDMCISRPVERLSWGIPLPFDEAQVTYVWFDALINYVSAVGYGSEDFGRRWPADFHVIGKDILVPPHAVYWPIMLKAAGIEIPKSLLAHGWWLKSGNKMSKSTGEIVNPLDIIEKFGPGAFRYFVIREMNVGQDSDFATDLFLSRYNNDLGNDLGNLVNRVLNMTGRYRAGVIPAQVVDEEPEQALMNLWSETAAEVVSLYEGFQFHTGLDRTFTFIRAINRYAEQRAPWKLAKSEEAADQALLDTSLAVMAEGIRLATTLLIPVMPDVSERIFGLLASPAPSLWNDSSMSWSRSLEGKVLGERTILFPRIEIE